MKTTSGSENCLQFLIFEMKQSENPLTLNNWRFLLFIFQKEMSIVFWFYFGNFIRVQ